MKRLFISLFILTGIQIVNAGAETDKTYYQDLGQCMAYIAVKSELDGKKEMNIEVEKNLAYLGDEFMFEASKLNIPEQDAQNFVVYNLVNYNLQAKEKGIASLDAENASKCNNLIAQFNKNK